MESMAVPVEPRGARLVSVDGRTYPLQAARVAAEASGGVAFSTLTQTYRNPYKEALEVTYTLPLPADGAVVGYTMKIGERTIRGEVRSREEARQQYEKAMLEGRSAALLEQQRDDTFTQKLGQLPAGQTAEIAIEVLHPLAFLVAAGGEGARWEYRFPTVSSVRYEGAPGRVPDAERIDADRAGAGEIPTRIELALTLRDGEGPEVRRVESMPLDRDLIVRWPAASEAVGVRLVEGPGLPGDDGRYGLLTIVPPAAPQVSFARDLTILLDASGSMSGEPLEWAKTVAGELLQGLSAGDHFEVVAFADKPESLTDGLLTFSAQTLAKALRNLNALSAGGCTEMLNAVVHALKPLREGSQHQVVLITDGQIGFEGEIVAKIARTLPDGARLHAVGVGAAPNRTLTLGAARAGRGIETFVCGDDEVAGCVARLAAATARPVLTDVRIEGVAVVGVAPARPRDVMAGQPLVVAIELTAEGGAIDVRGNLAGERQPWSVTVAVPPLAARVATGTAVPLGALFGRETIADMAIIGARASVVAKVAMRHRIASRETSLVAVADEPTVDPRDPRRSVVMPVEVPAFMSAEGLGLELHAARYRVGAPMMIAPTYDDVSGEYRITDLATRERSPLRTLARFLRSKWQKSIPGRVLAFEGGLLVIEYEVPGDGYLAPEGEIALAIDGQPAGWCTVDDARSSPEGPHDAGLLLRVAVRRPEGWAPGTTVVLTWGDDVSIEATIGEYV